MESTSQDRLQCRCTSLSGAISTTFGHAETPRCRRWGRGRRLRATTHRRTSSAFLDNPISISTIVWCFAMQHQIAASNSSSQTCYGGPVTVQILCLVVLEKMQFYRYRAQWGFTLNFHSVMNTAASRDVGCSLFTGNCLELRDAMERESEGVSRKVCNT